MTDSPIELLERWQLFGGHIRVLYRRDPTATISLLRCDGIEEQRLTTSDPAALDWLDRHSTIA
jgi:hypothetical protein